MSTSTTIKQEAIRALINEVLDGSEDPVVKINPIVDPNEYDVDPVNPSYVPQSKVELINSFKSMIRNVPDELIGSIYDSMKDATDVSNLEKPEGTKMKNDKSENVEETIRIAVKKILSEISPRFDASYSGTDWASGGSDDDDDDDDKPKRAYKSTAIGGMHDVSGASFEQIASDLGFSVAGAKQAVDKALLKAQWVGSTMEEDPDMMEVLVLQAMDDYIKMLVGSGELTDADVALMKDHPDIVRELDGFREFLNNSIRRARKDTGASQVDEAAGPKCSECGSSMKTIVTPLGQFFEVHDGKNGAECAGSMKKIDEIKGGMRQSISTMFGEPLLGETAVRAGKSKVLKKEK